MEMYATRGSNSGLGSCKRTITAHEMFTRLHKHRTNAPNDDHKNGTVLSEDREILSSSFADESLHDRRLRHMRRVPSVDSTFILDSGHLDHALLYFQRQRVVVDSQEVGRGKVAPAGIRYRRQERSEGTC